MKTEHDEYLKTEKDEKLELRHVEQNLKSFEVVQCEKVPAFEVKEAIHL